MTASQRNFRDVLDGFNLDELNRLNSAFDKGKVIRFKYVEQDGNGCLLHFLRGIISRSHLQKEFGPDEYPAIHNVVQSWDLGTLTARAVRRILAQAIQQRKLLHAEEEKVRCSVRKNLARLRLRQLWLTF